MPKYENSSLLKFYVRIVQLPIRKVSTAEVLYNMFNFCSSSHIKRPHFWSFIQHTQLLFKFPREHASLLKFYTTYLIVKVPIRKGFSAEVLYNIINCKVPIRKGFTAEVLYNIIIVQVPTRTGFTAEVLYNMLNCRSNSHTKMFHCWSSIWTLLYFMHALI